MASIGRSSARSLLRQTIMIAQHARFYSVASSRNMPPNRPVLKASQITRFPFARFESTVSPPKQYVYEDIKKLAENPDPEKILVDVREPAELAQEGFIPTAINIPYKSSPQALSLSEDAFEEKFGFAKPSKDKELVFYCLGGVRCNYAQELAGEFGYEKRGNYSGSWEDWVENEQAAK
ncbi:Rhodanese-like domain-containing protein [Lipomyces arxii]|uniref:Rhodanese-like domain-containing protein n=1 Tax=Lipomyces arxii TaxID=56418 RepID=UPI0034CF3B2E